MRAATRRLRAVAASLRLQASSQASSQAAPEFAEEEDPDTAPALEHPLAQRPDGTFCYGFYWHEPYAGYPKSPKRPPAQGDRYRLTAKGPGVTPLVRVCWDDLPDYDASNPEHVAWEQAKRKRENQLFKGVKHCRQR